MNNIGDDKSSEPSVGDESGQVGSDDLAPAQTANSAPSVLLDRSERKTGRHGTVIEEPPGFVGEVKTIPHNLPIEIEPAREDGTDSKGWHSVTGESEFEAGTPETLSPEVSRNPDASPRDHPHFQEQARLIGSVGADAGRYFSISRDRVLIGRSSNCSLVLAEPSVSRQHARIERQDDGFVLIDLESGNGTFVNGERVAERAIQHGDELGFGNGTFQFLESSGGFRPVNTSSAPLRAEEKKPAGRSAFWFVTGGVVLCTWLLVSWAVGTAFQRASLERRAAELTRAFSGWRAGVEFFKVGDWEGAEARFRQVLEEVPSHEGALRYLDAVERERKAAALASNALDALKRDELGSAYLDAIRVVASVHYADVASSVLRQIGTAVDRRVARAEHALERGLVERAELELNGLDFVEPYRSDIRELRARIATRRGRHHR